MAAQRPILLVDDDPALIETLLDQFADDGEFAATPAASIQEAEAKLGAPGRTLRCDPSRYRLTGRRRPRPVCAPAQGGAPDADHHADRL